MPRSTQSLHTIVIAGNPNAGKTTIFNSLAGTRQRVANYPGVTVERKESVITLPSGERVLLVDLPGCYSLTARSPEEQIAHDVLFGRLDDIPSPSLVLCIVDASNLERNLYLTTQLADTGLPLIVVLNMIDIAKEKGLEIDPVRLSQSLGFPVVPTIGRKGQGIETLVREIDRILTAESIPTNPVRPFIESLPEILNAPVQSLANQFSQNQLELENGECKAEALWALLSNLEGDDPVHLDQVEIDLTRQTLRDHNLTSSQILKKETEARYQYINQILTQAGISQVYHPHTLTERLDAIFLHPVWAPIIFVMVFGLVFQSIFSWATPAMDLIDSGFGALSVFLNELLPESFIKSLILSGVLCGVGNTIIFLPQILILFFFLGILEDSGYLARAAFLMDRLMSSIGLDGKAFIPLLSSFACAIPGIMASRTIPNRKDRLVTILIAPLMACSARLPVYTLVIGTVFVAEEKVFGFLNLGGLLLLFIYFLGIFTAVCLAALFKKTLLKSPKPILLLELPTYKCPSLKTVLIQTWDRCMQFLKKAGTIILSITILLWALLSFPRNPEITNQFEKERQILISRTDLDSSSKEIQMEQINLKESEEIMKHSFAGRLGHLIEPLIAPLGFNWKIGIGLIGSFAAREVFVTTMGVVYGISTEGDETSQSLRESLRADVHPETGKPLFTPLVGLSLLIFYAYACQCMSTLAIVRRETLSWRWPGFMLAYMSILAWCSSFLVFQVGRWLGYE